MRNVLIVRVCVSTSFCRNSVSLGEDGGIVPQPFALMGRFARAPTVPPRPCTSWTMVHRCSDPRFSSDSQFKNWCMPYEKTYQTVYEWSNEPQPLATILRHIGALWILCTDYTGRFLLRFSPTRHLTSTNCKTCTRSPDIRYLFFVIGEDA